MLKRICPAHILLKNTTNYSNIHKTHVNQSEMSKNVPSFTGRRI